MPVRTVWSTVTYSNSNTRLAAEPFKSWGYEAELSRLHDEGWEFQFVTSTGDGVVVWTLVWNG